MAKLVYFSSATSNTEKLVKKLGIPACCIPLRPKESLLRIDEEYALVVPTYGGGNAKGAVPKQVVKFLNDEHNRFLTRGVISGGDMDFGTVYGLADDIVAVKCHVPHTHEFGSLGTPLDVVWVCEGLEKFWQ